MSLKIVKNKKNKVHDYIVLFSPSHQKEIQAQKNFKHRAQYSFDDIVAHSGLMRDMLYQAQQAAKGHGAIFIQGENGSGRNYCAQAIHNAGSRRKNPFISIDCSAIPQEHMIEEFLISSQNKDPDARSKFEMANGGTLYLEQVEYLIPEVQATLLQLIKTGLFNRMNGNIISLDIRIIATSNISLEQEVVNKRFSRQLLLELQTFTIKLPALRKRPEDIPYLIARHMAHLNAQLDKQLTLSDAALELLIQYPWPGNLRELENVTERAANYARSDKIEVEDLPDHIRFGEQGRHPDIKSNNLQELEKRAIIRSAIQYTGKIANMCQDLQISRTTLWRKLKNYDIDISCYKK